MAVRGGQIRRGPGFHQGLRLGVYLFFRRFVFFAAFAFFAFFAIVPSMVVLANQDFTGCKSSMARMKSLSTTL
jgi:hypothetical protein